MHGYVGPIDALTTGNRDLRRVLFPAGQMQLVLIAMKLGEEIGTEVNATHEQFFRIENGRGEIRLGDERSTIKAGGAIVVPAGMRHNLTNSDRRHLRLYTLYAPPLHIERLIETTKAIADKQQADRALADKAAPGRGTAKGENLLETVATK